MLSALGSKRDELPIRARASIGCGAYPGPCPGISRRLGEGFAAPGLRGLLGVVRWEDGALSGRRFGRRWS
jgi:hypothetical protein